MVLLFLESWRVGIIQVLNDGCGLKHVLPSVLIDQVRELHLARHCFKLSSFGRTLPHIVCSVRDLKYIQSLSHKSVTP